jgi:hypothetical protein
LAYQTIFTAVSFASEPELAKKTRRSFCGESATSFSDRSIAGWFALCEKEW